MIFSTDQYEQTRMAVINTTTVLPQRDCSCWVHTPDSEPVEKGLAWIVASKTKRGTDKIRLYPLNEIDNRCPPAHIIISREEYTENDGDYIYFDCPDHDWLIIRPFTRTCHRVRHSVSLEFTMRHLTCALAQGVRHNLLSDSTLSSVDREMKRVENLLAKSASTPFQNEREVCNKKAQILLEKAAEIILPKEKNPYMESL